MTILHRGIPRRAAARRLQRGGCCRNCSRIDWEGVVKVFFSTVGFFVEVIFSLKDTGRFVTFGSGQHATMFFFFGLSGLADILVKLRTPLLPRGSEYLFGILALVVEALLFMFHLHGRSAMDVLVHTLLIYVLYATIVVCRVRSQVQKSAVVSFPPSIPAHRSGDVVLAGLCVCVFLHNFRWNLSPVEACTYTQTWLWVKSIHGSGWVG
jgi:hypothetical protein